MALRWGWRIGGTALCAGLCAAVFAVQPGARSGQLLLALGIAAAFFWMTNPRSPFSLRHALAVVVIAAVAAIALHPVAARPPTGSIRCSIGGVNLEAAP